MRPNYSKKIWKTNFKENKKGTRSKKYSQKIREKNVLEKKKMVKGGQWIILKYKKNRIDKFFVT